MTKSELRERVHADAMLIGIRPAARKWNVNEDTACSWAHRFDWKLPASLYELRTPRKHPASTSHATLNLLASAIQDQGEHSRAYLSGAVLKASHAAAQCEGSELLGKDRSIGVLNAARTGDVVHGWQASRQAGTNVAVQVNVPMPTPEERAERERIHDALDAIARKLRE